MCAGTDAEVIAKQPIVEVVTARRTGSPERRDLVAFEAGPHEHRFGRHHHVGDQVVIRQRRRLAVKHRVGFQRELVVRDVVDLEGDGRFCIRDGAIERLVGQPVHDVDVDAIKPGRGRGPHGITDRIRIMQTPEPL